MVSRRNKINDYTLHAADLQHENYLLAHSLIIIVVLLEVKPPQRGPSWELLAVEQENQRLEEEILRIQIARDRRHNYEGWRVWFKLSYSSKITQHAFNNNANIQMLSRHNVPCFPSYLSVSMLANYHY